MLQQIKRDLITALATALAIAAMVLSPATALAWDSASALNPTHPTHSYFTEWAIDQLSSQYPEIKGYRDILIEGANQEMHELAVRGQKHGINLNEARAKHKGTNEGTDDMQGWWADALAAYQAGNKEQAYFLTGIMLHMVQDMGAPAHANKVYHQGNVTEFDNFEFMALSNWKPDFSQINKSDPGLKEPWEYYNFSKAWTKEDAPNYHSRDSFSKTWLFASDKERQLLRNRQARTCAVSEWTLRAAEKQFLS